MCMNGKWVNQDFKNLPKNILSNIMLGKSFLYSFGSELGSKLLSTKREK